ncbi:hypothetical protein Taro_016458 [Colocasia esculenta]|uniref:peptidylprolyl isomerase n=1 Tax=Colocasia esculenta TaxID=4460 RepID=A0A843UNJ7_COLES|nr:hypothetical protein [Colocasia esculenta]
MEASHTGHYCFFTLYGTRRPSTTHHRATIRNNFLDLPDSCGSGTGIFNFEIRIEVKPGKSYTHVRDGTRGALRVSQATLGNGTATKRSVVQCSVGNKKPVLLCSLLPDRAESCSLDLRFEKDDEVVFSVVGPRSIHLTGYFLEESGHGGGDADDSDSYGSFGDQHIWEVGSDDSGSSEDDYESDFIDDGDVEMSPAPRPNSGVVIEEIIEDEKPIKGITNDQHLENKNHAGGSDEGEDNAQRQIIVKNNKSPILESEDEDGFPISSSLSSKNIDNKALDTDRKRKFDAVVSGRKDKVDAVSIDKSKKKNKDKAKSLMSPETGIGALSEQIENGPTEDQNKGQPCQGECEKVVQELHEFSTVENSGKLKKKKKEQVKREETTETRVTLVVGNSGDRAGSEQVLTTDNVEVANTENSQGDVSGKKSKRKKKRTTDGNPADNENKSSRTVGEDANDKSQITQINENGFSNSQERMDEDEVAGEQSQITDANSGAVSKKKQKKNKKLLDNDSGIGKLNVRNEAPRKPRTFANGLVIEELSMGQPDGKRASPGKTVFVRYIGKLRNGKIFDSNVGQRPFKFRLGVGQVIKGWDVGVDGMRIGDKRRLTIPPSMGYGEKGAGGVIPGNSWLIFDVELVDVK